MLTQGGETRVTKQLALGRLSLEMGYVMPDRRSVYLTDDGTNVRLYLFVADVPGELTSGTLYAARWRQRNGNFRGHVQPVRDPGGAIRHPVAWHPVDRGNTRAGAADLSWVNLGTASRDAIAGLLRDGTAFYDIFQTAKPNAAGCPDGFTSVNVGHHKPFRQCLKLRPSMEAAASRLETRRYAALRGATTEWRKMEGITYDPDGRRLYLALSEISRGMEDHANGGKPDDTYDAGGPNHIRLPYNECGAVYHLDVRSGERDSDGLPIASDFVAVDMVGELEGGMTQALDPASDLPAYPADGPFAANRCDLDAIANPDNLTIINGYHTLIAGEDSTDGHQNDATWAYDLDTRTLTRIQTTPYGAENTSPCWFPNIGGFGYLMSVVQHPYGETDEDKLIPGSGDERAYTGYIGPFPALP